MRYYNKCTECGSNLDPGERCTCKDEADQGHKQDNNNKGTKKTGVKKVRIVLS